MTDVTQRTWPSFGRQGKLADDLVSRVCDPVVRPNVIGPHTNTVCRARVDIFRTVEGSRDAFLKQPAHDGEFTQRSSKGVQKGYRHNMDVTPRSHSQSAERL